MRLTAGMVCILTMAGLTSPPLAGAETTTGTPPLTVHWLPETLCLIQRGGGYGRIIRLQDSRLLCAYSRGPQIRVRASQDEGRSWGPEATVTNYAHGVATNAEVVQLKDGTILVGINGRPKDRAHPFTIECARSADNGKTWSTAQIVYAGGKTFQTGCWEPAFLELPDGTVQLYFANEAPFPKSHEQEITMVHSADRGMTWSAPKRVTFRAGHRDGMAVPLLLRDRRTLVVSIEDNGLNGSFKPVLCRTALASPWANAPVLGDSPDRWDPLSVPLARNVYAGAPYICQTAAGHTVLSFQYRKKPTKKRGWDTTFAVVCVGDPEAKKFGELSYPFASKGNPKSIWNSVFAKSTDTVTLVSSATIDGVGGVWAVDGRIVSAKP